jgi:preprotein translocase subunit SecD
MKKLIMILIGLFIISCGARKAEKKTEQSTTKDNTVSTDKSTVNTYTNVKDSTVIETNFLDSTKVETIEYTPIDPSKESSITDSDGRTHTFKNLSYKKTKKNKSKINSSKVTSNSNSTTEVEAKNNKIVKADKVSKVIKNDKLVDRKSWSLLNLLWLLIPMGIILLILNKDKTWWI